jgi:hypothetical protein
LLLIMSKVAPLTPARRDAAPAAAPAVGPAE